MNPTPLGPILLCPFTLTPLLRLRALLFACLLACAAHATASGAVPQGFVDVVDVIPDIRVNLRYHGSDNFMGRPVEGYASGRLVLTRQAAEALAGVQRALRPYGLGLLVYDGYRPQRAVNDFVRWAEDLNDEVNKAGYYPDVDKSRLFAEGYIASRSGHSRGSTLDLTLVDSASGQPLDMGTAWDHFGPESWPAWEGASGQQHANRLLLRTLMMQNGFEPYPQEWWHFTLVDEPFPDTYFDFPIR